MKIPLDKIPGRVTTKTCKTVLCGLSNLMVGFGGGCKETV